MSKLQPERLVGLVAVSYLILIPAGAFYAWRKVQEIDKDVNALWVQVGEHDEAAETLGSGNVRRIKKYIGRTSYSD